ncbi:MAG: hypothetical protein KDA89_12375, partial [Planctomycetaceae bacterium]|nr:hypothetical protein [Planctomycetaceae bacterium]
MLHLSLISRRIPVIPVAALSAVAITLNSPWLVAQDSAAEATNAAASVPAAAVPVTVVTPPTIEQVHKALDLSEMAARRGLIPLSMEAVEKSLSFGPPLITHSAPPTLKLSSARVDTSIPPPPLPAEHVRHRIRNHIAAMLPLWKQAVGANAVYDTLKSVVFPANLSRDVALYGQPAAVRTTDPLEFADITGVAETLISVAADSNNSEDLLAALWDDSKQHSVAARLLSARVLLLQSAGDLIPMPSDDVTQRLSASVTNAVQLSEHGLSRETAELMAVTARDLMESGLCREQSAELATCAAHSLWAMDDRPGPVADAAVFTAAQICFSVGRTNESVSLLELLTKDRNSAGSTSNASTSSGSASLNAGKGRDLLPLTDRVARELFARGLVPEAVRILPTESVESYRRQFQSALRRDHPDVAPVPSAARSPSDRSSANHAKDSGLRLPGIRSGTDVGDDDAGVRICWCDLNGGPSRVLYRLTDVRRVTALSVSQDGRRLALEAAFPDERLPSDSSVFLCDADGSQLSTIGRACLPSLSADGHRLLCSRYSPHRGIWIA